LSVPRRIVPVPHQKLHTFHAGHNSVSGQGRHAADGFSHAPDIIHNKGDAGLRSRQADFAAAFADDRLTAAGRQLPQAQLIYSGPGIGNEAAAADVVMLSREREAPGISDSSMAARS
jgi:hypothetical protein